MEMPVAPQSIRIALPKGRIQQHALPLLAECGIELLESPEHTRKLLLETTDPQVSVFVARPTDVPVFVQHGAADIGIVGKDTLLEHGGDGVYEPVDMGIARCRLVVAGYPGRDPSAPSLRIATKYPHIAQQHFAARRQQVSVIKLYGAMELAPLVDLADVIVDLVDTGETLRANGLIELETICDISSRLIVNRAASKIKHRRLTPLIARLRDLCT